MPKKKESDENERAEDLKSLREDADKRLNELKGHLHHIRRNTRDAVSDQPALALGVAFVAGMALVIILSRLGD